jgi:hypothetical protein
MYIDGSIRLKRRTTAELSGKAGTEKDRSYYILRDNLPLIFSFA